jgi:esterase
MNLFYRKYGEGPDLVILHGLYGSSDNWVTIAKKISSHFTVYLPDQRNHGLSPHNKVHDYNSLSNDLYEFANNLKLKKFYLAGHSMGGKAAMMFAMKWPEMILGLLIADISPTSDDKKRLQAYNDVKEILRSILGIDLSRASSRADVEKFIEKKVSSEKTRNLMLKNLKRDEENRFTWKLNAHGLLENIDKIVEGLPFTNQVTGFPVIFLKGENSSFISEEDNREIAKFFPAADIKIIKNAGHWLHADNPEEVRKALLELLI